MRSRAEKLLVGATGGIVERIVMKPRAERCLPIPEAYGEGQTRDWITSMTGGRALLWRHQALALSHVAAGRNVVVSTGTASGKSLVFMTPIVHELLNGNGKAIVFYPQKALGGDQLQRFQAALAKAGLDPALVGELNGDVLSDERDAVLAQCRLILATPDVLHAWVMRQVQATKVQNFLRDLRLVVIDEAHVMEGVFGSNSAYLFRRLRSAHCELVGTAANLQWIAATATIRDPAQHLEQHIGCPFAVVGEEENGAPFHGLTLMHVNGPAYGRESERLLGDICLKLAGQVAPQAFIAFADSRQGVEHVAKYVSCDDVLPYRGGYAPDDRRAIEAKLHGNELRGVISTSALELGIDVPQFEVGINLGIPQTRKALRQRIGRIGRSMPGAFAVIAPATAFAELGGTFREYVESEVEPSRLYLDNRCIQVQAARCLLDECSFDPANPRLPDTITWPSGFQEMFAAAQPGAIRPRDLDQILAVGSDCPHHAYPLRAMRETDFALRNVRNPTERLGTIDLEKALRETYPGATYCHMRRTYRVIEWRTNAYEHSIMLEPVKALPRTQPLLSSRVSVSTAHGELIDGRLLESGCGTLAEIMLKVADSVEGYRIGSNNVCSYRDLRKKNWHMSRRIREFATTGVVLRIKQSWFAGQSAHALKTRQAVAEALAAVLAREHNIASCEIRTAHARIAVYERGGPRPVDDAIVLFDNVVGGLRLTSPLFSHFEQLLGRLDRASTAVGDQALLSSATVERLREWHSKLGSADPFGEAAFTPEVGEQVIFAPGSVVAIRVRGNPIERKLIEPAYVQVLDQRMLGYRYECREGSGWVPADQIEPIGHDWHHAIWNPETNELREMAA